MKKIFTFAAVAMALMVVIPASAQKLKFGLKGGLNVTNMSFNEDVVDASNRAGFFIGPTVKLTLPIVGLSFDAAALYDQKEAKINADEHDDGKTLTQKSFQIPVNVRYGVGLSKVVNVFAFTGPQFGFNIGDDYKDINWKWKDSNFSWNVGLGATVLSHLQVTANYNIACGTTGEATVLDGAKSVVKGKNNAWQIGVAYYF